MSAGELRGAAARSRDANATRRMLALALVLEGHVGARIGEKVRRIARQAIYRVSGRPAYDSRRDPPSFGRPMPYKFNESRRHKIPKARYRVTNWPEYDAALIRRGSLTVWMTEEAVEAWHAP